ncbi:MAG TPA: glycosyltransferase [Firmicutes bacterium]|nr:glycosyltransferase [Bacillota bacterium]
MITISLCMIVRNEEAVLGRCLDSVQGIPDEVIIVDTGSQDQTREIAARYTDRIYDFPWIDDFAAARNFAFSKATKEYLLWLDADDILKPTEREKFLALKETLPIETDMVMMPYQIAEDDAGRATFSYFRERLMKRACGYQWQGAVHEAVTPSGRIRYEPIAITHRKVSPGDPDRNLKIFEKLLAEKKELVPREWYYYARELWYHRRYAEAEQKFLHFLSMGGWKEDRMEAWLILSQCQIAQGNRTAALQSLYQSFMEGIPRAEICCAIGDWYREEERYPEAIYWYETARTVPDHAEGFQRPDMKDFIPLMQLCVCYDRTGDHEKARQCHLLAKRQKPEHPSVLYNEAYFNRLEQTPSLQ